MEAIVYVTNTGNTQRYAKLLAEHIDLPVYSLEESKRNLKRGTEIIFLGWVMANEIKGYKEANEYFSICMVCAVGMNENGSHPEEIRKANFILEDIPLFTLQGGLYLENLKGANKMIMKMVIKKMKKDLLKKNNRTDQENNMLDLMIHGGSRVCIENLSDVLSWYKEEKG
ncbi:hypothetical protein [Floccifex sp.]|uniref:hypothetical protein n=1 Tax=Floccifex sp. TaxID=2815810 RepID=UPI003F0988EB